MNTKTMEGLVGARTNMELVNTPMRVYKEARRRGDTATMDRAMGYVSDLEDKAQDYKVKADEGMKADAEEEAKAEREKAIERRREEREELNQKLDEKAEADRNAQAGTDTVEISEEGKCLLKHNKETQQSDSEVPDTDIGKNPMTYSKTGGAVPADQSTGNVVSVSV